MCVVSMVYDHFKPEFDGWQIDATKNILPAVAPVAPFVVISQVEISQLRSLIKEFKEAVSAAKVIDKLTNQPDCEDPEKKKN